MNGRFFCVLWIVLRFAKQCTSCVIQVIYAMFFCTSLSKKDAEFIVNSEKIYTKSYGQNIIMIRIMLF